MPSIQNSEKSDAITLRCSPELKKAVRIAAAEADTSIEDLCAEILSEKLIPEPKKRRTV